MISTVTTIKGGKAHNTTYEAVCEETLPDDDMRRDLRRVYWSSDGGETVSYLTSHVCVWPLYNPEILVVRVGDYGDRWIEHRGLIHTHQGHAYALAMVLENPELFSTNPQ